MSLLASIRRGPQARPPIITIYGGGGIGKSSFAAAAPAPIFIQTEDGLGSIDTSSFPLAKCYGDVVGAIEALLTEQHSYQTVVLDSLDHLEPMVWAETARRHGKADIEAFGYGKGFLFAQDVWRELLAGLIALRERGMAVVLIAHSDVKRYEDPVSEPYDRYVLKLHKLASALIVESSDVVGFAAERVIVKTSETGFNKTITRGISTGERLLHVTEKPAYVAKNRYTLPDTLPLSWDALVAAMNQSFNPVAQAA